MQDGEVEHGIDLHSLLRKSALAGASAAARALEAGWIATATTERSVPCRQIHGMHSARHLALVHPPADRAPEPEHRFANFIARLGGHLSERGWWFRIRGDAPHHFVVFVTVASLQVLGVFRVDRDLSGEEMVSLEADQPISPMPVARLFAPRQERQLRDQRTILRDAEVPLVPDDHER